MLGFPEILTNNWQTAKRQVVVQDVAYEEQNADGVTYQLAYHAKAKTF